MKTITVRDLIDLLEDYDDDDMPVVFATNYGDRGNTQQAHAIRGDVEEVVLTKSAYSESGYAVSDTDNGDDALRAADGDEQSFLRLL